MSKIKSIQIVIMAVLLMVTFALFQKKMGADLVYGYGYDSSIISVNSLVSSNGSPQISGSYTGGPYNYIYVKIVSSDGNLSYWAGGYAIDNNNGIWTLPAGSISPELIPGIYNVVASATKTGPDMTTDNTTNELKITANFSEINISSEVDGKKAKLGFENISNIPEYKISSHDDFKNSNWENVSNEESIDLNVYESGKFKYYIKFRDIAGNESETFTESFNYTPDRFIKNSRSNLRKGDTLIQTGKRFSKNSTVTLYFSDINGNFDSSKPQKLKVQTSSSGGFSVNYLVKKLPGKYKWYAVDEKNGKKSKVISYKIKK